MIEHPKFDAFDTSGESVIGVGHGLNSKHIPYVGISHRKKKGKLITGMILTPGEARALAIELIRHADNADNFAARVRTEQREQEMSGAKGNEI